ncbi:MAG: sugar ABC transporter substrate-binding protein [Eubacteriales bacterium]|nr:sugar ABC transporter substrate-binding protein [Eubacteriales bacterium]
MKKKLLAMTLAGVMAAGCLTGCGSSSSSGGSAAGGGSADTAKRGEGHTIAVVLKTLNSDYWSVCAAGVEQAEEDFGCEVMLQGPPSETSYDEQMNEIDTVLQSGTAEAIVIAPLQPETTANIVANANIPVLAVDTTFESDKLLSYIGVSNEDAAKAMGEYAAEQLGSGAKVALLAGTQGDTTSADRMKGYTEAMEEAGCTVLETQYTDAATDRAVTCMEGLLQKYPEGEIDAVFTLSDDVAMGAASAVEQAGRDEVKVYGFGGISGAQPVKDGTIEATVNINPYEMGYNCVARALDAIEGKEIETFYPTEAQIIDQTNVDEYLVQLEEWTK